ncbi:putative 6-phospho-3-hexuloisomerase [Tribonema minus]|uniref:Putative 6-phospho-3-hexuloisomerase n=1 Tax=Tribonema minus TaxID=303371 RepID=A0A835ZC26_9STRA|nr:putative 6-phospho-3-hexuloisomerase [Tribonema minus]
MPDETDKYCSVLAEALKELQENVTAAQGAAVQLIEEVKGAKRICVYGVGREGLAIKGFAMRLFHMGLQHYTCASHRATPLQLPGKVSVVGEMTCSAVGAGDLLIATAGPGYFSTVAALSREARHAGARVLIITSQPPAAAAEIADVVLQVPATCLPASFELALQLWFDVACVLLVDALGLSAEAATARHTNLE